MNEIINIFKSQGSFYKSILTSEDKSEISKDEPVSIISIAVQNKLDKLLVIDDTFFEFPKLYKNCNKKNIQLIFGIDFIICNDAMEKSERSLKTESKVCILMKNSDGYKDLLNIHNLVHTNLDFCYYKHRLDWKNLQNNWTDNLILLIPQYNGFIHKNLLFDSYCVPDFGKIKPLMSFCDMGLPFDYLLEENIKNYAKNNKHEIIQTHYVYYYKASDAKFAMMKRIIEERGRWSEPKMDYFCSSDFHFKN